MAKVSVVNTPVVPLDEEVHEAVRRSIDLLGGPERFASPGDRVLVKPNILASSFVGITDRRVTYAVAKTFKDAGCDVTIGENTLVATVSSDVFEKTRYRDVARRAGVKFLDLRRDEQQVVKVPDARGCETLKVARSVLDADLLVSVPVMKTHPTCFVTLSLKNMWGTIGPLQREQGHRKSLDWTLAELNKVLGVRLAVVDGIAAVGYRFDASPQGLIIAGDDPVATDTITALRMGINPQRIGHIKHAHELGVGEMNPEKIELVGATLKDLVDEGRNHARKRFAEPWVKPTRLVAGLKNVQVVNGDACDSCLHQLSNAIKAVGVRRLAEGPEMAILVGPDAKPVEGRKLLVLGHCLERYADRGVFVDYCLCHDVDIQQGLEVILGERKEVKMIWDELLQKIEKGLPGS